MIATIPKLLSTLNKYRTLFEAMFEKRHRLVPLSEVLVHVDEDELNHLVQNELLINNDGNIELEDALLTFLEESMQASSDVEIGDVDEMLTNLKHHITLYHLDNSFKYQERQLHKIQRVLKKIPNMVLKNLNLLQLHIGLSYKTQQSHHNKLVELQFYQTKLEKLIHMEGKVQHFLDTNNDFFKHVGSHETLILSLRLRARLRELRISLTALQQEVIEFINRQVQNIAFYEHMIKLKELKNAVEIKERTNILHLLERSQFALSFEKQQNYTGMVETDYIYEESFDEIMDRLRVKHTLPDLKLEQAKAFDEAFWEEQTHSSSLVDIDALHEGFMQQDLDLFTYVNGMQFEEEKSSAQCIEIYCQMALMFEAQYTFLETFATFDGFEYVEIVPKVERVKDSDE